MAQNMMDGKVVVVTGSGGGIGRDMALALAAAGAKVVVNDIGTSLGGEGRDTSAADGVVAERYLARNPLEQSTHARLEPLAIAINQRHQCDRRTAQHLCEPGDVVVCVFRASIDDVQAV